MAFANSLDPGQAPENIGPDRGTNCLTLWWYFLKEFFQKKVDFEKKINYQQKSMQNYPVGKSIHHYHYKNGLVYRSIKQVELSGYNCWNYPYSLNIYVKVNLQNGIGPDQQNLLV